MALTDNIKDGHYAKKQRSRTQARPDTSRNFSEDRYGI